MAKKRLTGEIIKKSGTNTYKVRVVYTRRHPKYMKVITVRRHFLVHSEKDYDIGASVVIEETKPISKRKHFQIIGTSDKVNSNKDD